MNDRRFADLAASRRPKRPGRRCRREGCDGKAGSGCAETVECRRTRGGEVERSEQATTNSTAERAEDQSLHDTVAVAAGISGCRPAVRLRPDRRRTASRRHHTALYRRHPGQCFRHSVPSETCSWKVKRDSVHGHFEGNTCEHRSHCWKAAETHENGVSVVKVFKNAHERNAAVKYKKKLVLGSNSS